MKSVITAILIGLFITGCATPKAPEPNPIIPTDTKWYGSPDQEFMADLTLAFERLKAFANENGWELKGLEDLVSEVRYFPSKELFDAEILALSPSQNGQVPPTYVATMDKKVLRVVSWAAYAKIYPEDVRIDYIQLLQHELAHQLHVNLVGDKGMGPVWFYEGFAVVAAAQYPDAEQLPMDEVRTIVNSKERGSYEKYGALIRTLAQKYPIKKLVEMAKQPEAKFVSELKLGK